MTKIEIEKDELVIRVLGLDALAAFKRELHLRLTDVEGVRRGVERSFGNSIRAPGLSIPGFKAGTYYGDDGRSFWDVQGNGEHAISIYLRSSSAYDSIFVDVEEPDEMVRMIARAVATPR
jgi:hypothetical protein